MSIKMTSQSTRHGMPTLPVYPTHITAVIVLVFCGSVFAENYTSTGVPPVIHTGPPPHRSYNDQHPIKLECKADGSPPLEFKWFKNGRVLNENSQNKDPGILRIKSANSSDQGYYQCQASNLFGIAMSNITFLERIFLARIGPRGSGSNASYKQTVGEDFVTICNDMRGTAESYEWRKFDTKVGSKECPSSRTGKRVHETSRISIYEENGSIAFSNLMMNDSGTYKCFARGGGRTFGAGCFVLSLDNPFNNQNRVPKFMHHSRSPLDVRQGEDFHLQCFFSGNPTPTVKWHKNGSAILHDRFSIDKDVAHRMTIKNAELGDSGYYECRGENVAGQNKEPERILVRVHTHPILKVRPTNQNVSSTQRVNFTCKGEGTPTPIVTWYRNTTEIKDNSSHIKILNGGSLLMLERVREDDTGTYHCNLSNAFGYKLVGAYLIVSDDFPNVISTISENAGLESERNAMEAESSKITLALIPIGVILAVIIVILVFLVIRRKRSSLSYQLGNVEPPDTRRDVGGADAAGDGLLAPGERDGSAASV